MERPQSTEFNISIKAGKTTVNRNFFLNDVGEISFTVALDSEPDATVLQIHRKSIEQVISALQALLEQ